MKKTSIILALRYLQHIPSTFRRRERMNMTTRVFLCVSGVLLTGCTTNFQPTPLASNHPASVEAEEAPRSRIPRLTTSEMQDERAERKQTEPTAANYACPMHSEVQSNNPGQCPKCGMAFVKK